MKHPETEPTTLPPAPEPRPMPPHTLIDSQTAWDRALAHLQTQPRLAIDLEANSMFAYRERVCLIQISSETADYIIDPLPDFDLGGLGTIIADPLIEKVFHASEYDLILLKNGYGWDLANLFDTMWAARILGHQRIGLAGLLEEQFGIHVSKQYQRSDWCKRPLSTPQLAYAQTDTHYLLRLRDKLAEALEAGGHTEEAAETFAELAHVRIPNNGFDPNGFWGLNGVYTLSPSQRATVQALYLFRDSEASRRDLPPFKVMGDQTIMELAETAPKRLSDLATIHGMSDGQISRYGSRLLSLIREAQQAEPPTPPRSKRPSDSVLNRFDRLHKWRKGRAQERGVESDVIVGRDALWAIANEDPKTLDEIEALGVLGPWRLRTYGPEILHTLRH